MTDSDRKIFFKNCISISANQLLWYDNLDNKLKSLSESPHVEFVNAVYNGLDLNKTQYVLSNRCPTKDTMEGHPERFHEFANTVREFGYDNSRNPKVKIVIDGCGRFILADGLHRSSIMYCLGSPFVVEIIYREFEWRSLRHHLYNIFDECKLYHPIEHLDFAGWPCWRHDTKERISIIGAWLRDNMPEAKSGLDVGCHAGSIAIGLAKSGYEMVGVDNNDNAIAAARILASIDMYGRIAFFNNLDFCGKYDFAVCLSLLNHYACDESRWESGIRLFSDICSKTNVIFYDCPSPQDPVGGGTKIDCPQGMSDWLMGSGIKGTWKVIAEKSDKLQRTMMVWRNDV